MDMEISNLSLPPNTKGKENELMHSFLTITAREDQEER